MTDEKRLLKIMNSNNPRLIDDALNDIYETYKPLLIFVASRYLNDTEDIKDVVQETFIEFFQHMHQEHKNIKAYLTIACKHHAIDVLRKKKHIQYMSDDDINALMDDDETHHNTFSEMIHDLRLYLQEEEVNIIVFHLVDGLTFQEIAMKMYTNANTIKTRYYRALRKYQKQKGLKVHEKN
ncbi:MAG: sigma-70 family RNA polymerase sigma factor [Anaeroplasma bactoclasticum]|nr:sigma-70 family RNA polymerase sigma factor [Anaeroplasma bactoclasticum]